MKLKKGLCMFLSFVLIGGILSGCNPKMPENTNTPAPAMGRYVEQEITLPDGKPIVNALISDASGNLTVYAVLHPEDEPERPGMYRYTQTANGKWAQESVEWLAGYSNIVLTEDKNGGFYAVGRDAENHFHMLHTSDGKTAEEISIPSWSEPAKSDGDGISISENKSVTITGDGAEDGTPSDEDAPSETPLVEETLMPTSLTLLENGDLLLGGYSTYYRYTSTGEKVREYPVEGIGAAADSKYLYTIDYSGNLTQFSLEDGSQVRNLTSPSSSGYGSLVSDSEGNLYYCSSNGILRLTPGGNVWETVVDGSLTSLASPSISPTNLFFDGNGGFYVSVYAQSAGTKLLHYTYSEDTPTVPDTELTVYSLHELPTVRQAITAFQNSNANVHVTYRVGVPDGDNSVTASDIVRSLNTEILAGKGPDVLVLDGLPIDSYIEKGILTDLSSSIHQADLLFNVTNAYQKNGKTYAIPARFSVPVLIGDKDVVNGIQQLSDLAKQNGDKPFMLVDNPEELLQLLASTSADAWVQNSTLDTQTLTQFFTDAKAIFAANDKSKWKPEEGGGGMAIMTGSGSYSFNSMGMSYLNGECSLYPADMSTLMALPGSSVSMQGGNKDAALCPLPGQKQNVYIPRVLAGVNAAGDKQELSKQFIQTILSADVQNYTFSDGLPVNQSSIQKEIAAANEMSENSGSPATFPYMDFLNKLSTPSTQDSVLMDAVLSEGAACLSGEKSPEEAAAEVEKKIKLYLAE